MVCRRRWPAVIEFTHHRGVKLRVGQPHPRGTLEGELVSYGLRASDTCVIALKAGPNVASDLAQMYRTRFVGVGTEVFRVAGLERFGAAPAWVHQEWICFPRPRPAGIPGEPSRERRP